MDIVNYLLPAIEQFRLLAYWVIMLFSFVESLAFVGVLIPGTFFNILVGFLAAQGALNVFSAIIFSAVGSACGDILSYYLGGHSHSFFSENNKIFKSSYLEKGTRFLNSNGGKSIFIGKFIGPFRPIIPFVAGLMKTDKKTFIAWSILSSFAWAATYLILGYFFGQAWQIIILWSTRAGISLAVLIGIFFLFYLLKGVIIRKGQKIAGVIKSGFFAFYAALNQNTSIKKILSTYPNFFNFISARFNVKSFFGLSLTLLTLTCICIIFLLAGTVEAIIKSESLVHTDIRLANLLAAFRNPGLTTFFTWITLLGKSQIVFTFTVVALGTLVIWKKKRYIFPLLVAMAGSSIFAFIAKYAIYRTRPGVAMYLESSPSFPSGHATIAVSFYGFLTYIIIRNTKSWRAKVNYFFFGFWLILLIGFSRLYLGVHFLSDVWGGYLVGSLWLIIGIAVAEIIQKKQKRDILSIPQILDSKALLSGLVFMSILFYIIFAQTYNPIAPIQTLNNKNNLVLSPISILSSDTLMYTESLFREKQKPINFIFIADNNDHLKKTFAEAGWSIADNLNVNSITKSISAKLFREPYNELPMTSSFWNTNLQDFGLKKYVLEDEITQRHQIKIWMTNNITQDGRQIYVGASQFNKNRKIFSRNKTIPDMDLEREYIFEDLQTAGAVEKYTKEQLIKTNAGPELTNVRFATDGKIYIIEIK